MVTERSRSDNSPLLSFISKTAANFHNLHAIPNKIRKKLQTPLFLRNNDIVSVQVRLGYFSPNRGTKIGVMPQYNDYFGNEE